MTQPDNEPVLTGEWDGGDYEWEVHLSTEQVDKRLCTSTATVVISELVETELLRSKIVIPRTLRGWELPGGHWEVEKGENLEEARDREVWEEVGARIEDVQLFAHRKIRAIQPKEHYRYKRRQYPYPLSFILYYFARQTGEKETVTAPDVLDSRTLMAKEAQSLLHPVEFTIVHTGLEAALKHRRQRANTQ